MHGETAAVANCDRFIKAGESGQISVGATAAMLFPWMALLFFVNGFF